VVLLRWWRYILSPSLPIDFTLWNKLGATLANAKQHGEAMYAYQKAIDIRPTYIRGEHCELLQLTNCYHLRHAVAGHVNMGMAYQHQDRQDQAARCFAKALEIGAAMNAAGRQTMQAWSATLIAIPLHRSFVEPMRVVAGTSCMELSHRWASRSWMPSTN
jgi:tetratricopeptide (TPR) repeat protein